MQNVIILIVISAFTGGSIAPFAKHALEGLQPFSLIFRCSNHHPSTFFSARGA
jgi:hypothetical protein